MERVEILDHLWPTYEAFLHLSPSRQTGAMGGEGYIPISEIVAWCDLMDIVDLEERAAFLSAIRAMDAAYLDERAKVREREDEKPRKP